MDPFEVPVSRLTVRPAAFRLLGAMAAAGWAMAGCAPSPEAPRLTQPQGRREVSRALQKQVKKAAGAPVGLEVEGLGGNDFTVEDADGRRVLTAKVARVAGRVKPGTGLDGPVVLEKANCTLYRHGKPHLELESPEVLWDGQRLYTRKSGRARTADRQTELEGQEIVWTARTAVLELKGARLQGRRQGAVHFVVEAPEARLQNEMAYCTAGASAENAEGRTLRANQVRWGLKTGKLEADGNVILTEPGSRITGQRLRADTRLLRGRLSGGVRLTTMRRAAPTG